MAPRRPAVRLPFIYRIFFLVIEPISALVGAFYTHFKQPEYLQFLREEGVHTSGSISPATSVAMSQLANMYFFFALNEAIVLRSTWDMKVWKAVLFVLLVADVGHLYSMRALGPGIYYDVTNWNAGDMGNVPWVYAGAALRICFLAGIGLGERPVKERE
ncbi:hypothetical protein PT974_08138 [Cladobotryum mycophilum]|uniref:DUF7704 domain-containing protein n=1 Tax=Cladobotryum mycophilum TaxID=491253 RepID=A0ABR0SCI5_9HYPO